MLLYTSTAASAWQLKGDDKLYFHEFCFFCVACFACASAKVLNTSRLNRNDREMTAICHKWLGDTWRMRGEFRKARQHHSKHMEYTGAALSCEQPSHDVTSVNAPRHQDLSLLAHDVFQYNSDKYWVDRAKVCERMLKCLHFSVNMSTSMHNAYCACM